MVTQVSGILIQRCFIQLMAKYKVLYISGSIGLGHVIKDLAIANKLRVINPDVEITWIATSPATEYLEEKGESIHALTHKFSSYSAYAEKSANKAKLNLVNYVLVSLKGWYCNICRPATLVDGELNCVDLELYLFVDPEGGILRLDEEEFEDLGLRDEDPHAYEEARAALEKLEGMVRRGEPPFCLSKSSGLHTLS